MLCFTDSMWCRSLRAWQGQALDSMSQGLSRSMQQSAEMPQEGFLPTALHHQPQSRVHHLQGGSPTPTLRSPTNLRNLASLATPLATPHWMQGGSFQTPSHIHTRTAGTSRVPKSTTWGQAPPLVPTYTLTVPADSEAVPRAASPGQSQQPFVPNNTLAIPADTEAVPRHSPPGSGDHQAAGADRGGQAREEEELHLLSSTTVEEEVLVSELQALRAARQEFQLACLSQVLTHC